MRNKNTPEVRFSGFAGDWEQRKLGEVLKVNSGRDYKHLQQGDIPVYGTGGYMLRVNDKLSNEDAIGIGRKGTINKPQLLKAPFWTVDTLFYMNTKDKNDLLFCYSLANKINWKKYDESTGVPSLSKSSIDKISISIPTSEEQSRIGNFFKQLDDTITLHQQELDTLKQTKEGFLQKMFPKEGESVPATRFPGFSEEWELRKFEEVLNKKDGIRRGPFGSALKKDSFVSTSNYVVYEQQNAIYDNYETRYYISKEKFEELKKFQLCEGDFILSGAGTIGRISRVPKGIQLGVFNQALIRFKINQDIMDPEYFIQWIRSGEMQKHLTGANPGSAITNLVPMSEVKKWDVLVPMKEEQIIIGKFFKQLDDTIALQQQELDALKETKKAFLQKMFI